MPIRHLYVFFGKMFIQIICPFLNQTVSFLATELHEFFIFFCILAIYQHMICKHLLSFSRLPFHFVDGFLFCAEKYDTVPPVFVAFTSGIRFKTSSPRPMSGRLPLYFLLGILGIWVLHSSL